MVSISKYVSKHENLASILLSESYIGDRSFLRQLYDTATTEIIYLDAILIKKE